ncbi:MAG: hypothetical protein J5647_03815 [Spirochaetaceae bacterium]|nr:hypothetical protein [Spirochaetaceae bacterium]
MKVTREMTNRLGIRSMTIDTGDGDAACILEKIKEGMWHIRHTQGREYDLDGKTLMFRLGTQKTVEEGTIRIISGDDGLLVAEPPEGGDEITRITRKLMEYETNEKFERRSESRVKVGITGARQFGLDNPQQYVISGKDALSCVLVDVSVHGVQLLMENCRSVESSQIMKLKVSFESPSEEIIMSINKVYSHCRTADGRTWAYVSCQILEPVHFVWRERVLAMLRTA